MYYLRSYPKSFPSRRSVSRRSPISSFHFRASSVSPFFSASPYKIRLTPLSTAFTHFDRGGWVLCFLDLQTFRPRDVQTLRTFRHSDFATFRPFRRSDPSDLQTSFVSSPYEFLFRNFFVLTTIC